MGSSGIGMTRTAFPSTIHSSAVFAVMRNFRRIAAGMET